MKFLKPNSLYTLWNRLGELTLDEANESPAEIKLIVNGHEQTYPVMLKYDTAAQKAYLVAVTE